MGVAAEVGGGSGPAAEVAEAPIVSGCVGDPTRAEVSGALALTTAICGSAEGSCTSVVGTGLDTLGEAGIDCNAIVAALRSVACMNKTIPTAVVAATPQMARPKRIIGANRRFPCLIGDAEPAPPAAAAT
jgi:hypothetical protein